MSTLCHRSQHSLMKPSDDSETLEGIISFKFVYKWTFHSTLNSRQGVYRTPPSLGDMKMFIMPWVIHLPSAVASLWSQLSALDMGWFSTIIHTDHWNYATWACPFLWRRYILCSWCQKSSTLIIRYAVSMHMHVFYQSSTDIVIIQVNCKSRIFGRPH